MKKKRKLERILISTAVMKVILNLLKDKVKTFQSKRVAKSSKRRDISMRVEPLIEKNIYQQIFQ
jgi:hypothetical protein